jgi:translation initiation factor 2 beta subunit (eIF-2beta)/eIF-5
MKSKTPRTDAMVKQISGWKESARARNLAYLCRKLERTISKNGSSILIKTCPMPEEIKSKISAALNVKQK